MSPPGRLLTPTRVALAAVVVLLAISAWSATARVPQEVVYAKESATGVTYTQTATLETAPVESVAAVTNVRAVAILEDINLGNTPEGGGGDKEPNTPEGGGGGKEPNTPEGGGGGKEPNTPEGGGGDKEPSTPEGGGGGKEPNTPESGGGDKEPNTPEGGGGDKEPNTPEGGGGDKEPNTPEGGGGGKNDGNGGKDGDNESTGVPNFLFVLFLLLIIVAVLYGTRTFPRACPFFRRNGGSGGARGQAPQMQQYARLDGGAFYGDEEDYRGMEPRSAAGAHGGSGRGNGSAAFGHRDVILEMQGKLRGGAAADVAPASSQAPGGYDGAVHASGVVDRNPAGFDAFFGGGGEGSPAASLATVVPAAPGKNSFKAMRKGKLGPATSVTTFSSSAAGPQQRGGGSMSGSRRQEDWGWSDEEGNH